MIKALGLCEKKSLFIGFVFLISLNGPVNASPPSDATTQELIDKVVALTERGDPASLEKMTAGYLVDAAKKFNPNVPADTWKSVRSDVNEIVSNKIRSGYGEQALITRNFIKNAKFSDEELRHLITLLEDPVMGKWTNAMRDGSSASYMMTLSQQVNNQMWFVVSIVLRRHGLETQEVPANTKQKEQVH